MTYHQSNGCSEFFFDIILHLILQLLQEGQTYSVVLKLELPETPGNLKMGMFMSNIVVQGYTAKTLNVGEYRWSKRRNTVEELELPIVKSSSKPVCVWH